LSSSPGPNNAGAVVIVRNAPSGSNTQKNGNKIACVASSEVSSRFSRAFTTRARTITLRNPNPIPATIQGPAEGEEPTTGLRATSAEVGATANTNRPSATKIVIADFISLS
jgi:hypothetical protein